MSWNEIVDEYRTTTIGPGILEEVRAIAANLVKSYSPRVYGGVDYWRDGLEDLVQDVVLQALIHERQLDYIMTVSRELADFRALITRQVRRVLARRRQRTVIDNLLDRCRQILRGDDFIHHGPERGRRYWRRGREGEPREPTGDELRTAAVAVSLVSRTQYSDTDRAPTIYSDANLETLVDCMLKALPGGTAIADIDAVLRMVLTDWLPGLLTPLEGLDRPDTEVGAETMVVATESVELVLARLTAGERSLLAWKLAGVSDGTLADRIGVSRPTFAARKKAIFEVVEAGLSELDETGRDTAVQLLCSRLASEIANA